METRAVCSNPEWRVYLRARLKLEASESAMLCYRRVQIHKPSAISRQMPQAKVLARLPFNHMGIEAPMES